MNDNNIQRRDFLKKSVITTAGAAVAISLEEKILLAQETKPEAEPKEKPVAKDFPQGKIGNLSISRVICGGNLISGYAHSRDLVYVSQLLKNYFTDEKIFDTLEKCEENGINTLITHVTTGDSDMVTTNLLRRYWDERGGKIQWIAQCAPFKDNIEETVKIAIDNGAVAAFLMGGMGDKWTKNQEFDKIAKTVEVIQQNKMPAGVAGHSLQVPVACEKHGINVDFYVKTFHPDNYWSATPKEFRKDFNVDQSSSTNHNADNDNIWCINPEETMKFMQTVKKPWIAYKVLAAGAVHPREGFKFAFENGVDFILAGMFDFQITENVIITKQLLSGPLNRTRPWYS